MTRSISTRQEIDLYEENRLCITRRRADADAQSGDLLGAESREDRFEAVVAAGPPACSQPETAER